MRWIRQVFVTLSLMASWSCADAITISEDASAWDLGTLGPSLSVVPSLPAVCGPSTVVSLIAGRLTPIGTIAVTQDGTNLFVVYRTDASWPIEKTALFIGSLPSAIPTSGGGNPQVGRFPYKARHGGANEVVWAVPLASLRGSPVIVAAFAELSGDVVGAWGQGDPISSGGSWATYFTHEVSGCAAETVGVSGGTVSTPDGNARLQIDPGALLVPVDITIDPVTAADLIEYVEDRGSLSPLQHGAESGTSPTSVSGQPQVYDLTPIGGAIWDFGPDGLQFESPVVVSLHYDESMLPLGVDESDLGVFIINGVIPFLPAPSVVDTENNVVTATIEHFSFVFIAFRDAPVVDVRISHFADLPDPLDELETLTYGLQVDNAADSEATVTGTTLFVGVNGDVVYEGASALCSASSPTISLYDLEIRCPVGDLAPAAFEQFAVRVIPQSSGTVEATALLFLPIDVTDINPGNNSVGPISTLVLSADPRVDVRISHFADLPDPLDELETLTYGLQVDNAADSEGTVSGTTLFVGVNGDVVYEGASALCSASSPTISLYDLEIRCPVGDLAPAAFEQLAVRVIPQSPGTVESTALLFLPLDVTDINPSNNSVGPISTLVLSADPRVDVRISHFADLPDPLDELETLTYGLQVDNAADSEGTVSGTTLFVGVNGDVVYEGASALCSASSPTISLYDLEIRCPVGDLAPAAFEQFAVRVIPQSPGTVEATAIVLLPLGVTDTNPANNEAGPVSTTVVTADMIADLRIALFADSPDPVEALGTLTYAMRVQNSPQSDGPVVGVQLILGINGDVEYLGANVSCSASSPTISLYDLEVVCALSTIDLGSQTFPSVSIVPQSPGTVTAIADLVLPAGVQDPSPDNSAGPIGTTVVEPSP